MPKGSLEFHEESWNAYPYSKTVITVTGMSYVFVSEGANIDGFLD